MRRPASDPPHVVHVVSVVGSGSHTHGAHRRDYLAQGQMVAVRERELPQLLAEQGLLRLLQAPGVRVPGGVIWDCGACEA